MADGDQSPFPFSWVSASVDDLRAEKPTNSATDSELDEYTKAALDDGKQNRRLRRHFFYFITVAVSTVIIAGIAVVGLYFGSEWGHVDASVIVAWFSAEIVQTIGLAYIVAKYLFSKESEPRRPQ